MLNKPKPFSFYDLTNRQKLLVQSEDFYLDGIENSILGVENNKLHDVTVGSNLSYADKTLDLDNLNGFTTDDLKEGVTNLYYADELVDSHLSGTAPASYDSGVITIVYNTTNFKLTDSRLNTVQDIATDSSPSFNNLGVGGNLTVTGNLTVNGSLTSVNTTEAEVKDHTLTLNAGETGNGLSNPDAGIEIDRGTATTYRIVFQESDDTFRAGEQGSEQAIATREDSPLNDRVPRFDSTSHQFQTNATTSHLPEGTNLYYTDARADARITAQKGVSSGIVPLDANTLISSTYLNSYRLHDNSGVGTETKSETADAWYTIAIVNGEGEGDIYIRHMSGGYQRVNIRIHFVYCYGGMTLRTETSEFGTSGIKAVRMAFSDSYDCHIQIQWVGGRSTAFLETWSKQNGLVSMTLSEPSSTGGVWNDDTPTNVYAEALITLQAGVQQSDAIDISNNTTDDLAEGTTNLYHTDARVNTLIENSVGTGLSYDSGTNTFSITSIPAVSTISIYNDCGNISDTNHNALIISSDGFTRNYENILFRCSGAETQDSGHQSSIRAGHYSGGNTFIQIRTNNSANVNSDDPMLLVGKQSVRIGSSYAAATNTNATYPTNGLITEGEISSADSMVRPGTSLITTCLGIQTFTGTHYTNTEGYISYLQSTTDPSCTMTIGVKDASGGVSPDTTDMKVDLVAKDGIAINSGDLIDKYETWSSSTTLYGDDVNITAVRLGRQITVNIGPCDLEDPGSDLNFSLGTLPAGFRPEYEIQIPAPYRVVIQPHRIGFLKITTAGVMTLSDYQGLQFSGQITYSFYGIQCALVGPE